MRLTWRQLTVCSLFFVACAAMAQNQINPANQIRWPMPDCANPMDVYSPQNNTCYRFDQIPPASVTWPPNCTPGMVYSPALNSCVPQGGTANNPAGQLWDVQVNGGTNFAVASPKRIRTDANGNLFVSGNVTGGPKINVQLPDYAGGADPSGTNDSLAAFNAAATAAATGVGANPSGYPTIYIPAGVYNLSGPWRVPCTWHIVGDGPTATVIQLTNNSAVAGVVITAPGSNHIPNGWECQGSIENLKIYAPGGHLFTGTLLETNGSSGYTLNRVILSNGGGIGLHNVGERFRSFGLQVDTTRWPIVATANEQKFFSTEINSPGADAGGYCMTPANCVNGQMPNFGYVGQQTLISASGNGTTLTVVVQGGNNSAGNNGQSPLLVGHTFSLSGISDIPAMNGFWQVASVANSTPTANQYTLTASSTASGTSNLSGAAFKLTTKPEVAGGAFTVGGAAVEIYGGSIKALWYMPCFLIPQAFSMIVEGFYCEGFPTNNRGNMNGSVLMGGYPAWTTTTAAMTTAATQTVAVSSAAWFLNQIATPSDVNNPSGYNVGAKMKILPADFLWGSSAASAAQPGVQRGQFEYAQIMMSADGAHLTGARNQSGSTAPANTAWNAGSVIAEIGGGGYGTQVFRDNHFSGINAPATGWDAPCVDGTATTCATVKIGAIPNGYSSGSTTQAGTEGGGGGFNVSFDSNEWWGNGGVPGSSAELIGQEAVKVFGGQTVTVRGGSYQPGAYPELSDYAAHGQYTGNGVSSPLVTAMQYSDGSWSTLSYTNYGQGLFAANGTQYESVLGALNTSGITDSGAAPSHEYYGQDCWYDMGNSTAPHSLNRFCLLGSPLNVGSSNPGIRFETWNGSAWVTSWKAFGNGGAGTFWRNTGAGGQFSAHQNTVTATATDTFNGPGAPYEVFNWWNGSSGLTTGCGWTWTSNTALTVTPTGLTRTYACNDFTTPTIPVTLKYTLPAGSVIAPPAEGRATLVGGTATVNNAAAGWNGSSTAYSLTNCAVSGTQGMLSVGTVVNGTSFVINSSSTGDTSTVCWWIH